MEEFWKDNHFTVRWGRIPEAARWKGEWKDFRKLPQQDALRYLILWHHKSSDGDINNIGLSAGLEYLELNWSNSRNIGAVPFGLRRLEMHYCTKLESAAGLAERAPEMRHLHLNACRRFEGLSGLLKLTKLEVLCLNGCGDLPDLKFLAQFPCLRDFRFVNTNVVDGDLSPLLSHPTLESVGTLDKRHYSHKADEISAALTARRPSGQPRD
jgi:hypothetical protein